MIPYAITFCFIVLDFLTGIVKALATKSYKSTVMRTGLFHKVSLLLVMALGVLTDFAQGYLELGVSIPIGGAICAYIVLMETGSSLENVCEINPEILPSQLTAIFGVKNRKGDRNED